MFIAGCITTTIPVCLKVVSSFFRRYSISIALPGIRKNEICAFLIEPAQLLWPDTGAAITRTYAAAAS
jgi:hypothetical protein